MEIGNKLKAFMDTTDTSIDGEKDTYPLNHFDQTFKSLNAFWKEAKIQNQGIFESLGLTLANINQYILKISRHIMLLTIAHHIRLSVSTF